MLVADDDRTSQTVAALMLRALGCDADIVADGPAAIAASESGGYSAILMDYNMPVMDGLAATREIRRRNTGRARTPIIAMTASAARVDRDRCFEAGMDDYLSKPVTIEALRAVLVRATGAAAGPAMRAASQSGQFAPGVRVQPQVAGLFLQEAPNRLEDIREAIARRDSTALAWATHRLRGAVANFGPSNALAAAEHLETMAECSSSAETDSAWAGREQQFGRLAVALAALLGSLGRPR